MTELRLVSGAAAVEPSPIWDGGAAPAAPLPRGRHGMPADLVRAHQRQRLIEAAAGALAEQGYGRLTATRVTELARVSSRTFYQHFEDLWACLLAAYESEAARLRTGIEDACAAVADAAPGGAAGN
ncbi:MAG: TetR/AcrR family transcriptional regulator, partial [Thermoleophilaceae bacterium]